MIERVAAELRRPVRLGPAFDAQVMERVARAQGPRSRVERPGRQAPGVTAWRWLTRPRTVRVSPLAGLAVAAGLAAVMVIGRREQAASPTPTSKETNRGGSAALAGRGGTVAARPSSLDPRPSTPVQFVLVAPGAQHVALVGDFNDWDVRATPLASTPAGGVWTIEVPLAPGRHRYAFVVDGARWLADPAAPRATGDDFGTPSSVVTVTERGA
jgi:hypothetical protein